MELGRVSPDMAGEVPMLRVDLGRSPLYCDGASRRSFLQIGMTGLGAWGLAPCGLGAILAARSAAAAAGPERRDTSLILIWLDGGPSQHDTYDPKPDAPAEYRGIWRHISTNVPGLDLCELFPRQAKVADKFSLLRSVHHDTGDHFTGGHWMLTGRGDVNGASTAQRFPFFGGIVAKCAGARRPGMPAHVAVPYASSIGLRPGYFGGSFLGVDQNPFETDGDPNGDNFQVTNLASIGGLSMDRLGDRKHLVGTLDTLRRDADQTGALEAMNRFDQQAFDLVTGSAARKAFDVAAESSEQRERYGRNSWGQSVLLARRLVEAGSTVVTCHFGGWDSHWDHERTMNSHLPKVDLAVSALVSDLSERGLLDRVMVMVCGEFGRTPRMNDGGNGGAPMSQGTPGRDHWGNVMSVLVAGGGLKSGVVVGASDRLGENPIERPLRPGDIHHTAFRVLGIDPSVAVRDRSGRPHPAIDHGSVIEELL